MSADPSERQASPPQESPRPAAASLRRGPSPVSLSTVEAEGFQLDHLDRDDYIPTVQPWLRHSSNALLLGAGLALVFIAVMPYRVVVRAQGAVRPAGELVLINAPFEGRVLSIDVKPNQTVRQGQTIVQLDPSEGQSQSRQFLQSQQALSSQEQAQSSQAAAELAGAELEVEKARSALQLAESEFHRYSTLATSGAVPQQLYEEKRAIYEQTRSSLAQTSKHLEEIRSQARSSVAQLERERASINAGLADSRRRLINATVRSPVAGVVFKVEVRNPLQTVSAGQPLASVAPSQAELMVKVAVRGEDIDNVQAGQVAELRLQGCPYPDFGTLPARVVAISPDAMPLADGEAPKQGAGFYEVTLKPERLSLRAGSRLCDARIGMGLLADITTRQEPLLRFVLRKTRILLGN